MSTMAIILAAGKGTRMKSELPKVLHEVCGRPMLAWVMDACREASCRELLLVIGHGGELVRQAFGGQDGVRFVEQSPQLGTGHAVMICADHLAGLEGLVLVLAGDGPLIRGQTLRQLMDTHRRERAGCTLATSILDDPARYGRILRSPAGELLGIVEYLDAGEEQRAIREVNVSVYCFDAAALRQALPRLTNHNAKGEYYLTDVLSLLRQDAHKLAAVAAVPPEDVLSINTLDELQQVTAVLETRLKAGEIKP